MAIFISNPKTLLANTLATATDVNSIVDAIFAGLQSTTYKILLGEVWSPRFTYNGNIVLDTQGVYTLSLKMNGANSLVIGTDGNITCAGTVTAAGFSGPLTGNVTGTVSGNAGTVTGGVYTTGNQSISGTKTFTSTIAGSITGNAATATEATNANTVDSIHFITFTGTFTSASGTAVEVHDVDFTTGPSKIKFVMGHIQDGTGANTTKWGMLGDGATLGIRSIKYDIKLFITPIFTGWSATNSYSVTVAYID